MYTKEELGFILYNNRSVKGVVSNFLPKLNPVTLIRIENQLKECKSRWFDDNRMVELNLSEFNTNAEDVIVTKNQLGELTSFFRDYAGSLSQEELHHLHISHYLRQSLSLHVPSNAVGDQLHRRFRSPYCGLFGMPLLFA